MRTETVQPSRGLQLPEEANGKMERSTARARMADPPQIVKAMTSLRSTIETLVDIAEQVRTELTCLPAETARRLDATIGTLREDLHQLPPAVAARTAQSLSPLERLQERIDQVLGIQRQTLEAMAAETAAGATAAMQERIETMDAAITRLSGQIEALKPCLTRLREAENLPGRLECAEQRLNAAAATLERSPLWERAAGLLAASLIAGLIVLIGQVALDRLASPAAPAELQKAAAFGRAIWDRATGPERALLRAIVARQPGK